MKPLNILFVPPRDLNGVPRLRASMLDQEIRVGVVPRAEVVAAAFHREEALVVRVADAHLVVGLPGKS